MSELGDFSAKDAKAYAELEKTFREAREADRNFQAELEMMHLAKAGEHILTGDWHRVRIEQETAHADWHMAKAADYRRMMENNGI